MGPKLDPKMGPKIDQK